MELSWPQVSCMHASIGDVQCVGFDREAEVVLFVPGSSEVFLTSRAAWEGLATGASESSASQQLAQALQSAGAVLV
jgi:hypothetical protein